MIRTFAAAISRATARAGRFPLRPVLHRIPSITHPPVPPLSVAWASTAAPRADLFAEAVDMIDHAKGLPDTESLPILRQAGALLESACGVADGTGDGRACTRLGRWTIFGVDGRPVDVRLAWDLLV